MRRHTPWHVRTPQSRQNKHAIVLGAGLAGCCTAAALARRGWQVILMDEADAVGCGASGNQQAVLYPKLSAHRSPLTDYMLSAFLFATRFYRELLLMHPIGELAGILQLPSHQRLTTHLQTWLANYPELGRFVTAEEASALAGITVKSTGLFVASAGFINIKSVCELLAQTPGITWVPNTRITAVSDYQSHVVVIANGYQANQFTETGHLPLTPVHGQMTLIPSNSESARLRIPLCGDGHILPARDGMHGMGATYHPNITDAACSLADDKLNLEKLSAMPTDPIWSLDVTSHWSGIRAATPDYLPLVGPVADVERFKQQMQGLATDAKRWIPSPGAYHPGLYACTGFGSRGLTTIPLAAESLACMLNHEPISLPRHLLQALSPARFLYRSLYKPPQ